MKRIALAAVLLTLAAPALGQNVSSSPSMPGVGTLGLGATLSSAIGANDFGGIGMVPGLQASYFLMDPLRLDVNFALNSTENVGTIFALLGGADYFLLKQNQFGAYLGGKIGFSIFSPSNGSSQGQFRMQLGGGAEYFFTRHFSAQLFEGLALSTNPTQFALISTIGLNWYF